MGISALSLSKPFHAQRATIQTPPERNKVYPAALVLWRLPGTMRDQFAPAREGCSGVSGEGVCMAKPGKLVLDFNVPLKWRRGEARGNCPFPRSDAGIFSQINSLGPIEF